MSTKAQRKVYDEERGFNHEVTEYWLHFYIQDGHCSLCGNRGVIDTVGVTTPANHWVGRLNYCICPNGQTMRQAKAKLIGVQPDYRN